MPAGRAIDAALLAAVLAITTYGSRLLGFSRADEVTIVFCGSKKSLASGLPMATVLLAGQSVGLIVLPLMLPVPVADQPRICTRLGPGLWS